MITYYPASVWVRNIAICIFVCLSDCLGGKHISKSRLSKFSANFQCTLHAVVARHFDTLRISGFVDGVVFAQHIIVGHRRRKRAYIQSGSSETSMTEKDRAKVREPIELSFGVVSAVSRRMGVLNKGPRGWRRAPPNYFGKTCLNVAVPNVFSSTVISAALGRNLTSTVAQFVELC